MKSYFSEHYAKLNGINIQSEDSFKIWYKNRIEYYDTIFLNINTWVTKGKILEIGSGIGGFLYYLKQKGLEDFIGIDLSTEQIEICKRFVTKKVVEIDAIEFLKNSDNFDYIFAFDLLEHLEKNRIYDFVDLVYNKLNKNGTVIIRTPNMSAPFGLFSRYIDFTHEVGFTEYSIRQLFSNYFPNKTIKLYNSPISKKRIFVLRIISRIIEKLYDFPKREIITRNIYLIAKK